MPSSQPTLAHSYDRRVSRLSDALVFETRPVSRGRRVYKSPDLELLADFGQGGGEPIRLQD